MVFFLVDLSPVWLRPIIITYKNLLFRNEKERKVVGCQFVWGEST